MTLFARLRNRLPGGHTPSSPGGGTRRRSLGLLAVAILVVGCGVGIYWSSTPAPFDVHAVTQARLPDGQEPASVPGSAMAATTVEIVEVLLDKPGGYLSNDVTPPSVFLDNMPNWEYGVVLQVRDFALALRNDMSRSQSQSQENEQLAIAQPQFNVPNNSWLFPASETEYRKGARALENYLNGLADSADNDTQFYARADNLNAWLGLVNKRLGALSQRLTSAVGEYRVDTGLAGDPAARQSTETPGTRFTETPWLEIDDVFYEARGSTWALLHLLQAARIDFDSVLRDKNALASLNQIIRELEQSQRPLFSPIVLNGSAFGMFANHSLTMASYLARANAALIDLRDLITEG